MATWRPARYGRSEGLDPLLDLKYSVPVTAYDTTVGLQYRKNTVTVVEAPFDALELKGTSDITLLWCGNQFIARPMTKSLWSLLARRLSDQTFLLGEPFSLTPGAENGKSSVTALRAARSDSRTPNQVIAARSRFSFGLDAMGADDQQ